MIYKNISCKTPKEILELCIKLAGGQTALARICKEVNPKITQVHIWQWLNRDGGIIPAEYVLVIEKGLRHLPGAPTRHELRPDIYPEE